MNTSRTIPLSFYRSHYKKKFETPKLHYSVIGSVGSAHREELDNWIEFAEPEIIHELTQTQADFDAMLESYIKIFEERKYDFVFIFNGRIHDTAAALEACKLTNTPYATHERTWFGKGLQINLNNDCISINNKTSDFIKVPTKEEIQEAHDLVKLRLFGQIKSEWRNYGQRINLDQYSSPNTRQTSEKLLVIPSSRSEFLGHPDYFLTHKNSIDVLENFINHYKISPSEIIIRGHPAWATKIGRFPLSKSSDIYRTWANKTGAYFIEPTDNTKSTYELMKSSRMTIFNGGSAVLEATMLGCPSVLLSPSPYQNAGFVTNLSTNNSIWPHRLPESITETVYANMLRYVSYRYRSQVAFFEQVTGIGPKKYTYAEPRDCTLEMKSLIEAGIGGKKTDISFKNLNSLTSDESDFTASIFGK